ncbi:uncharacterized protein MONOS_13039 [Monocercomonoides exilis]|uniref:uncharacterized protein n=1 Tax=Monocercomonoides exilis TaxID=2049356 RepID=UPI00355A4DF0|nr:hypothetical protein MONOS_13039 [Monocercomonoides exilis]|eukprot:MONOS_13039.1-p1 / transcript=MONOS_13039.1 / gene=MONOS_13039 / organism=Monocercomonoides_exilis_PA203 / gene_product=unspecified product / transcript_product=unspecified product / location=Mono_scaffold00770:10307-10807(-) / protein_length=100 / sequence_SO=supercontig / SO=protein_coding / is_pseudo=false
MRTAPPETDNAHLMQDKGHCEQMQLFGEIYSDGEDTKSTDEPKDALAPVFVQLGKMNRKRQNILRLWRGGRGFLPAKTPDALFLRCAPRSSRTGETRRR